jgi:peptidoglycan/xylan/chitin deacetylase (PgdA/CDA1 family)
MADSKDQETAPAWSFPDGISCVGSLIIAIIVLASLGIGLGSTVGEVQEHSTPTAMSTDIPAFAPTTVKQPLSNIAYAEEATNVPTPTIPPTATYTATPADTPTAIATSTSVTVLEIEPSVTSRITPLPTPLKAFSWTLKVPILMYHYISVPPKDADKYRQDLSVTPDAFRAQMQYLVDHGYSTIDPYDLSLAIVNKRDIPDKSVIITMDDGYRDNYENAYPILRELGLTATFFVVTDFIDQHNPNYMNWSMIGEMARAGMRIEPHSRTHPDLDGQEPDFVVWQVQGAQETLEAHIGYRPRYFSYPGGRYDDNVLAIIKKLDFWGAVTTVGGKWHGYEDRFEWTRVRVRNTTTLEEFGELIE